MSDKIGLFTGSFDPITNGHVDLIERASRLFDRLYVGIFYNPHKEGFFSIDVAKRLGVTTLVRGLRNGQDLDYEAGLHFFNKELAPDLETVFLLSQPAYRYISSSAMRELIAFQQDLSAYVPASVIEELEKKDE